MAEDRLTKFIQKRKLYTDEFKKESHKERLKQVLKKIMTTIMVGSIDEFEKHFGEVWGRQYASDDKNDDELDMTVVWNQCRDEVFNRGNAQIRRMFSELNKYEVEVILNEYVDKNSKPPFSKE